ncbi:MAG: PAS domain S-box protein [Opitutae bacterium]|nr:PAS domain S-box protein [Opitutae bacterium]
MATVPIRPPASARPALPAELTLIAEALSALPDAILLTLDNWSTGGAEIVWANPAFSQFSGYSAAELAGHNTRVLHGPKTELLAPAVKNPAAGESWLHRKDGTPVYATWNFSPVTHEGRETGYLLGLYRDTSETRRLQEALLQSQKLDTVGHLASGVAHDFNNLLSIINGYCEIMSGKITGVPAALKDLQEIHRAGLKAAGIARQILEFSRRHETESRAVNANTLIREIADILRRVVGDAVKVELRLDSDLGNMRIDPTQFQQVLLNLTFNARDAMPQGGRLTIRTGRHQGGTAGLPAGDFLSVRVTDTGAGMDEALQARIFEPFFTTKPHGTGLGLPTVLNIVKHAGGAVAVQSAPGRGTTFEVILPETPEMEQLFGAPLGALPATKGTERIWLVEADDVLRKMVSGILTVDGYAVRDFAAPADVPLAGAEAPEPPQLLLIDCGSYGALDLVRRLHDRNRLMKLLSFSVDSPVGRLPEFSSKALAHLPKPFALSTLLRLARGLLDNRAW